ncbi:MAG TPA: hypothetical protein VJO33_14800 [Gemmatimonadaceae bacterium]|nr:hypothetical protein [Gemmatimonadaceae bacterium]
MPRRKVSPSLACGTSLNESVARIPVLDAELPDSEGYIPSQVLWFVLSPLGREKGEQLVLLRYATPVSAIAYGVGQW